jgi:uncharacterized membrane protein
MMIDLSTLDLIAICFFLFAWLGYHWAVEANLAPRSSLNTLMDIYRLQWMQQMAERESRIVDANIMSSLQNGTAFFASTSLIALGAAATLLRTTDDAIKIFADLPLAAIPSRGAWEVKVVGLIIIFGYAFFKFSWAYRLFNFAAILIGATPSVRSHDQSKRDLAAKRAALMNISAAKHFTRGQRAFFFALAYFGWFAGPYVFLITTAGVLFVMWNRQHSSSARTALDLYDLPSDTPRAD